MEILKAEVDAINLWDWRLAENPRPDVLEQDASVARFFGKYRLWAGYKNSPDILFIGSKISRGYAQMLDTYRKNYSTKEKMGTLNFSGLEVQPLDERFATVTGHFHLERTAAGGGNSDGHFLLVFERTPDGWKVVRDDTTVPPKKTCD